MRYTTLLTSLAIIAYNKIVILEAVVPSDFYQFGPSHGDQALPRVDDYSSGTPISTPIAFFGRSYNYLFVSITFPGIAMVKWLNKIVFFVGLATNVLDKDRWGHFGRIAAKALPVAVC